MNAMNDGVAPPRYRAFISYSHSDERWGRWLHRRLEHYRVPPALRGRVTGRGSVPSRLGPVFRDRDELSSAFDLGSTVQQALRDSAALIVVCSPASACSRWVDQEVRYYQQLGRARPIFCVLVGGDLAQPRSCLPPALRENDDCPPPRVVDLTDRGPPPAQGLLQLIAGMLDLDVGELRQNEYLRRQRHLIAMATASVLGLALTSSLALSAISQRRSAEQGRKTAEGLIDFMLTDLRQQLAPVGGLQCLDAIGQRALDFYAPKDPRELSAAELGQRARALQLIAEINSKEGKLERAVAVSREALRTTETALSRDPNNPDRILEHAKSAFYAGHLARDHEEADRAAELFEQYLSLAQRLVALRPGDPGAEYELAYAYDSLGQLDQALGRQELAVALQSRAIVGYKAVLAKRPTDDLIWRIADVLNRRSSAELDLRRPDEAARSTAEALALVRQRLEHDPQHVVGRTVLGAALLFGGSAQLARHDLDATLQHYREGAAILEGLNAVELDTSRLIGITTSYRISTLIHIARGAQRQAEQALAKAEQSNALQRSLEPDNARWSLAAAKVATARARVLAARGDLAGAFLALDAATAEAQAVVNRGTQLRDAQSSLLHLGVIRADLLDARGRPDAAREVRERTLQQLRDSTDTRRDHRALLVAYLLMKLGRDEEAKRQYRDGAVSHDFVLELIALMSAYGDMPAPASGALNPHKPSGVRG